MTYADTIQRRAELRNKLGDARLTAIIGQEVERRRTAGACYHMGNRLRRMRHTPWIEVDGRRI